MAYVLANITQANREKIKGDAAMSAANLYWLCTAEERDLFPTTWAFDVERNSYLMRMPRLSRGETNDFLYLIFVSGNFYTIEKEGAYGGEMHFDDRSIPKADVLKNVEDEVTAAFAVYGCWGNGPLNERGQIEFDVVPEFTKKGA